VSFTASKDDFKLYLACPRKLALKTLGFRVREGKRAVGLPLSHAIGVSGERLTEEVLEVIASLQADRSKGEYVEFYGERSEEAKRAEEAIVEALRKSAKTDVEDEELREVEPIVEPIIRSTIEKSFTEVVKSPSLTVKPYEDLLESYKESYKKEMKKGFLGLLKDIMNKIPKVLAVYRPVLRNRDTCSLGYPDYQVETEEGHILVEVKNLAKLSRALKEARDHLLYYNSLLADREFGDTIWWRESLPRPFKSLIVVPRHGVVEEFSKVIPNFRDIAVEIWKIKKAALIDGVLPDVKQVPWICKRCGYKRLCEEMRAKKLEPAKPLPLIYAIAEHEVGEVRPKFIPPPPGFWDAYHKLMEKAREGDKKAEENLKKMGEYLDWLYSKQWEDVCKALYRAIPNEFDNWGGLDFLRKNFLKIMNTAHMFYPLHEEGVKVVLKLVMKRWESQH
jgi:hypothetical protein